MCLPELYTSIMKNGAIVLTLSGRKDKRIVVPREKARALAYDMLRMIAELEDKKEAVDGQGRE